MTAGWLVEFEVQWAAVVVLAGAFLPLFLFAMGLTGYYALRMLGKGAKASARAAVAVNERYQVRVDRWVGLPPYRFNPPPGWPKPRRDWLPQPGWEPDRTLPPIPADWRLWERTEPRPVPPRRKSPWAVDPAAARMVNQHDPARFEEYSRTLEGLRGLQKTAIQCIQMALDERAKVEAIDRSDPNSRSRWHPLEWAYRRACDDLLAAAEEVGYELRTAIASGARLEPGASARYRHMLASVDELIAAKADWAGVDRESIRGQSTGGQQHQIDAAYAGLEPWQQAEHVAAAALQQFGFLDARVTGAGTDRGLDVAGRGIAAQVKYTSAPVGRPVIQQLLGAAGGRRTAFFSLAGYTQQAVEEADERGMALFVIKLPSTVSTRNGPARLLAYLGADGGW